MQDKSDGVTEIGEQECPYCGLVNDRLRPTVNSENNPKPVPGDISICIGCAGLLIVDEDMRMRKPTESDMKSINDNDLLVDEIARAQLAVMLSQGLKHGNS